MTKFDELCAAYKTSRETYFAYRNDGFKFAMELMSRYKEFLGVQSEYFRFVPADETPKPDTTYTIPGAIHLNDDTYWHLGLLLTLFTAPSEYPQQPVLIVFRFKQISGKKYQLKISEEDTGHEITCGDESQFNMFFEFLQAQIVVHFENGLQEFLEQSAPLRTIGFVQSTVT